MTTRTSALAALLLFISGPVAAAIIWNGPSVGFTKFGFTDETQPENQDFLTDNVSLTRGTTQGLFNITQESIYDTGSPLDTQWAFQGLNGNPGSGVTAANFASLTFSAWAPSLGGQFNLAGNILNRPGVIHLVSDDIYLDVTFTAWGGGLSGGSFSYTRTTAPVPLPGVAWLLASGFGSLVMFRRRD